ncbi:CCD15 protein, partial [Rostratula benghalensis]|nr:CCD15 protein [Rostratula benghalensis]
KEQQREKAASLRRFQGEAERESCLAVRYRDSALHLTPRKSTCLFCSRPAPAIRCPAAPATPTQQQEGHSEPFQQQADTLSRTMKQVRRRLASCRTVPRGEGDPELPGSVWRRENPDSCKTAVVPAEDESEELLLAGHHDLPAEVQDQGMAPHLVQQDDDFYIKIKFEKFCDGSVKDSSLSKPPQRLHSHERVPLVLWAGVDQEETKKQVRLLEPSAPCFISSFITERCWVGGWDALSLSMCVPAGLRARRRSSAGQKSGGCRRWLSSSSKTLLQERRPAKPWPSLNWRRGE